MADQTDSSSQRLFGTRKSNNSVIHSDKENRPQSMLKGLKSAPTDHNTKKFLPSIPSAPEPRGLSSKSTNNANNKEKLNFKDSKVSVDKRALTKTFEQNTTDISLQDLKSEISDLEDALKGVNEAIEEYSKLFESRNKELTSIQEDIDAIKHLRIEENSHISSKSDSETDVSQSELITMRDELLSQIKTDGELLELAMKKYDSGRKLQETDYSETESQLKSLVSTKPHTLSPSQPVEVDEQLQDLLYLAECEYEAARSRNEELHQMVSNLTPEAYS